MLLVPLALTGQAQDKGIRKTIENGIRTSILQTKNYEWKEAFATCLDLDAAIAYKLNGTLRLDEEYKKGTRFVLELHS